MSITVFGECGGYASGFFSFNMIHGKLESAQKM